MGNTSSQYEARIKQFDSNICFTQYNELCVHEQINYQTLYDYITVTFSVAPQIVQNIVKYVMLDVNEVRRANKASQDQLQAVKDNIRLNLARHNSSSSLVSYASTESLLAPAATEKLSLRQLIKYEDLELQSLSFDEFKRMCYIFHMFPFCTHDQRTILYVVLENGQGAVQQKCLTRALASHFGVSEKKFADMFGKETLVDYAQWMRGLSRIDDVNLYPEQNLFDKDLKFESLVKMLAENWYIE